MMYFPTFPLGMGAGYPLYQIYVGEIPAKTTKETLYANFLKYGNILEIKLGVNKYSKKYAFISFDHPKAVELALENANNTIIDEALVRVDTVKNMKQYTMEANIFFRNIPNDVTDDKLKELFSKFGKVISLKLVSNENKSLGYGYVQFELKDSAEKCLKNEKELYIDQNQINVSRFVPRSNRENIKNNLFVKGLPENMSKEDILEKIDEVFGKYGEINSKLVAVDKFQKHFAFVCFKESKSAEEAKDSLNGSPLTIEGEGKEDEKMTISWVQSKRETLEQIRLQNLNNIYTKNLKLTVTEDQLKIEFSKFGDLISVSIPKLRNTTPMPTTLSAYICFKNPEDAKDAIVKSYNDRKILEFYEKGDIYVTFHQNREQRKDYLRVVKSNIKRNLPLTEKPEGNLPYNFQGQPLMNPYFNQQMQMVPPFMMPPNNPYQQYPPLPPQNLPNAPPQQNFNNNYLMNNMNMMQPPAQQNNPNNNRNMNMGGMNVGGPRKNMMDQGQKKNYHQGGGYQTGQQQQMHMGGMGVGMGGNPQQKPQQPYRQKRGGYQNRPYGNRPNQMGNRMNQNEMNYGNRQPEPQLTRTNLNNLPQQPQPIIQQAKENHILNQPLEEFMKNEPDFQRNALGTLLYPLVLKKVESPELAPKITGMLIDFESFTVADILEFIESDSSLTAAIMEAQSIIFKGENENEGGN